MSNTLSLHDALPILLVLVAVTGMLTWRMQQQEKLNHSLLVAIQQEDVASVARLLNNGADANSQEGAAPASFLSFCNNLLNKLLGRSSLSNGQQPGLTTIQLACSELPMPHSDGVYVQWHTKFRIVELLAERGANVNVLTGSDVGFRSFLLYDAYQNLEGPLKYEVMACLIHHGANVNARTEAEFTTLMVAAFDQDRQAVKMLLEHGAEVNWKNRDGDSALSLTKHHSKNGAVWIAIPTRRLLLQYGAKE